MALRSIHIRDRPDERQARSISSSSTYAPIRFVRAGEGHEAHAKPSAPQHAPAQSMAAFYAEIAGGSAAAAAQPAAAQPLAAAQPAAVRPPPPPTPLPAPPSPRGWFDSRTVMWGAPPAESADTHTCARCGAQVRGDAAAVRAHRQSMAHRLAGASEEARAPPPARAPERPPSPKYKLRATNRGYGMLAGMGWREGMGLGRNEGTALRTPLPLVLKHNRMGVGRRTLIERRADEAPRVHDAARARAAEVWHEPSERQTKRQRAQRERAARAEWLAVRASLK